MEFQSRWAFSQMLLMIIIQSNARVKQIQYMDDDEELEEGVSSDNFI